VLRLALLNTRAHGIFRPWFYRFSLGQHRIATRPSYPRARSTFGWPRCTTSPLPVTEGSVASTAHWKPNIWAG